MGRCSRCHHTRCRCKTVCRKCKHTKCRCSYSCKRCGYSSCRCCRRCNYWPCRCCNTCSYWPCRCCTYCSAWPCCCSSSSCSSSSDDDCNPLYPRRLRKAKGWYEAVNQKRDCALWAPRGPVQPAGSPFGFWGPSIVLRKKSEKLCFP